MALQRGCVVVRRSDVAEQFKRRPGSSVEDGAAMAEVFHEVMWKASGELLHRVGETYRYNECSGCACGGMHAPRIPVGWAWRRRALVHVLAPQSVLHML